MCFSFFRRFRKTITTPPQEVSVGKRQCKSGTLTNLPRCRTGKSTLSKSELEFVEDCIRQSFKKNQTQVGQWKYTRSQTFLGTGTNYLSKGKSFHTLSYSGTCKRSRSPSSQEEERAVDTEQTSPKEIKNYMNWNQNLSLSLSPLRLPSPLLRPSP